MSLGIGLIDPGSPTRTISELHTKARDFIHLMTLFLFDSYTEHRDSACSLPDLCSLSYLMLMFTTSCICDLGAAPGWELFALNFEISKTFFVGQ